MRDCSNVKMRELLPDLLHDRLRAEVRAEVRAHLESCTDCREELELLTQVRSAVRAPALDSSRIAAAVPGYRRRSVWSRAVQTPAVRIAAAIVLVAGSIWIVREGRQISDVTAIGQTRATEPAETARAATPMATELAVGEPLTDLTVGDLHALIEELDELDAITPTDAEVEMPSVRGSE